MLRKLTIPKLKCIARTHNLKLTGKKGELILRIEKYLSRHKNATMIQKMFRGYIVRNTISMRHLKGRKYEYVNNDDPVTLEPVNEIHPLLFSDITVNNYHYAFNIKSMIDIIRRESKNIRNPFTREPIPHKMVKHILTLFRHTIIINPELLRNEMNSSPLLHTPYTPMEGFSFSSLSVTESYYRPIPYSHETLRLDSAIELYERICALRTVPLSFRINDIFSELSRLEHYVDAAWFVSMPQRCYPKFYLCLKQIWLIQGPSLSNDTKKKMCRLFDPFETGLFRSPLEISLNMTLDEVTACRVRLSCVCTMEAMLMTASDDNHANLGAMYILMALTTVSRSARTAFPWLYDALWTIE
jgi:hypothetical protein